MPTGCHAACLEAAENLQGFQCIYSALSSSWEGDFGGKMGVNSVWPVMQQSSRPFTEDTQSSGPS